MNYNRVSAHMLSHLKDNENAEKINYKRSRVEMSLL